MLVKSPERSRPKTATGNGVSSTTLILLLIVISNAIMVLLLYSDIPSAGIHLSLSSSSSSTSSSSASSSTNREPGGGSSGRRSVWQSTNGHKRKKQKTTPAQHKMLEMRRQNFEGPRGLSGFVQFSAYRLSATRFVALGLSALALHDMKEAHSCLWEATSGETTQGNIIIKFPGEHHARMYEIVLLFCELDEPVSARVGGQLSMTIDRLEQAVYLESKGSPEPAPDGIPDEERTFEYNLTHCSAPMFGDLEPARIVEWMQFHRIIHGVNFFHMYDAGAFEEELTSALEAYTQANLMDVTDLRGPAQYDTWSYAQVLSVNDCAFKTRDSSRWVLMTDFDEYLHVLEPPHSLSHFLETISAPLQWLSFGSITFPLQVCCKLLQDQVWIPWAVEQLVFRDPVVHCRDPAKYYSRDACLKWDGHRKYVVNPRGAFVLQIHRVYEALPQGAKSRLTDSQDTSAVGLNAHTSLVRLHHYRGLGMRSVPMCQQIISFSLRPPTGFVRDVSVARMAVAAHAKTLD